MDKFIGFYPAGPVQDGEPSSRNGVRKDPVVKFVAQHGGVRVVPVPDLVCL